MDAIEPTANTQRSSRPGGRTAAIKARVLEATLDLFAEEGIGALRYETVAQRSGVHKTTLYRNWPNKDDLIRAAFERFSTVQISLQSSADLREDLIRYLLAIAEGIRTPRGRAIMGFLEHARGTPALHAIENSILNTRVEALQRRLDAATAAGELPALDAYFLGELLVGPVYLFVFRERRAFDRSTAEHIVDIVLKGIRATTPETTTPEMTPSGIPAPGRRLYAPYSSE
ncbi:TetR/AcrR family transcriptional regulator [Psychromicrobium sp. YIM B11713]|uniref:TetR/AcrR family transcriptional regulator n=1 Tax=Psychromicrobium sp. YIM B11713 TaxID=3145233 RepID=UPI00374F1FF7